MPIGNNILAGSSGQATGYDIDQSLRVDGYPGTTNQHLERSPSSSGNRKTFTISFWHKPSLFAKAENDHYIKVRPDANNQFQFSKTTSDTLNIYIEVGNTGKSLITSRVFRDPSSWYHFVIAVDTTQATASNRVKLYVNGVQETDFGTEQYPDQDWELPYNQSGVNQDLLWSREDSGRSPSGYFAEWHSIDGTALDASSFGETNADTNQWVPIQYTGSYGTNGFYLKFQDSSALGDDSSGNTNDFTPTNLVATDQVLDSPTNNFATLNPLWKVVTSLTLQEGNLKGNLSSTTGTGLCGSTFSPSSGKWYCEFYCKTLPGSDRAAVGIADADDLNVDTSGNTENTVMISTADYNRYWDFGTEYDSATGVAKVVAGDIVQFAWDVDTGKVWIGINNTWQGASSPNPSTATSPLATHATVNSWTPILRISTGATSSSFEVYFNAGQDSSFAGNKTSGAAGSDFYYTPPTGFKALCTDNLSDPSIADPTKHFNTVLYTGNGSTQSITGTGFQPDWLWIKRRSGSTQSHHIVDSVRGASNAIASDGTWADFASSVSSLDSDGFSLSDGAQAANGSGETYASWNWKAGGTASSNTDGTITSSVSANTDAGFSIISYTGNGTNGATVGHGLSQKPDLVIYKARSQASHNWIVYSSPLGATKRLKMDLTEAATTSSSQFNDTEPTSSVVTLGTFNNINQSSETFIAYAFHSVDGYSKVGKYTGNSNADGPMFYCGFKPSWAMFKATGSAQSWTVFDNKRNVYNLMDNSLFPDLSDAENDATSLSIDFVSNGIKIRSAHNYVNYSGSDYIVLAFAESPFKTSNAR